MRLFGGLSWPIFGRTRAGISRKGRPWVGTRGRAGPVYAGVLVGADSRSSRHGGGSGGVSGTVEFVIEDDGRITLGGVTFNRKQLREVVRIADEVAPGNAKWSWEG